MKTRIFTAAALAAIATFSLDAKITLPSVIGDNMVLQQKTDAALWGKAEPGSKVTVKASWAKKPVSVTASADGKWETRIATPEAGGPYSLEISDGEAIVLNDILIGEVWFCSGQSNMEMPVRGFDNQPVEGSAEAILGARPERPIRMCTVQKNTSCSPLEDCTAKWEKNTPEAVKEASATAYFFADYLQKILDVPVGILISDWGGTPVESWMDKETMKGFPEFDLSFLDTPGADFNAFMPCTLFNAMVSPVIPYTLKGFLWYQGESNVGKHKTYAERLKTMVELWRKEWGLGELPFYFVEIAPYGSSENYYSALLREAQFNAQKIIPNSGMISTNDLVENYEQYNIHPKDKSNVGKRLAYMALSNTYQIKGIEAVGPVYKSMEIKDGVALLSFDNAGGGFNRMTDIQGFEIAGEDKVFYPAKAELNGGQIKVSSDKVPTPAAVRYGFRDFKPGNVANIRELPLYPFRTDNWE